MVPIIQAFVPLTHPLRSNLLLDGPRFITVHDTSNPSPGANAEMHGRYLLTQDAIDRDVLWHFTVDDHEIRQHLPTTSVGWHAADGYSGPGNRSSIGIELCENADGDRAQTERNAAWLIARLLREHQLPLTAVVQHNHWCGKNCPHLIRARDGGWQTFLREVWANMDADRRIVTILDSAGDLLAEGWLDGERTVVPIRELAESLGLAVDWDPGGPTVTLRWPGRAHG